MIEGSNLFKLDQLPPACSLRAEKEMRNGVLCARFMAVKNHNGSFIESKWSGWFNTADCPIILTWEAFDFEGSN